MAEIAGGRTMKRCRSCQQQVGRRAARCPHCGQPISVLNDPVLGGWVWLGLVLLLVAVSLAWNYGRRFL
jgi:hypothetical protein